MSEALLQPVEELRNDLRRVMWNYPSLTIVEVVGILELLKEEMWDRLRQTEGPLGKPPA